ncbi:MAG: hypothetical protein CMO80_10690 [Verrucomicrobiales bacterium]|nr:hypothetical protein [Verrucomicrobiales bacterium]|tara:strand:- start:8445 stop:9125 length:681 start_codon:yes stop_codon:yes gene_type:complete
MYHVTQRKGNFLAPWDLAGTWVLGDGDHISNMDLKYDDELQALAAAIGYVGTGTMGFRIAGKDFKAPDYETAADEAAWRTFRIEKKQFFQDVPWEAAGEWVIGGLNTARVVQLEVDTDSPEGHLLGSVCYDKLPTINFRGERIAPNSYQVDHQWGGETAKWYLCETWTLGSGPDKHLLSLGLFSQDSGRSMHGQLQYTGDPFAHDIHAFSVTDGVTEVTKNPPEPG